MRACVLGLFLFRRADLFCTDVSSNTTGGAATTVREQAGGQPETGDVIGQELAGYRRAVRKCTRPKVNITQLLGLIVFTIAQLWRIRGVRLEGEGRWEGGQGGGGLAKVEVGTLRFISIV